jgi:histidine ammonia-lyase
MYMRMVSGKTAEVLAEKSIEPLKMELRDGLGLINGTSCMTGMAADQCHLCQTSFAMGDRGFFDDE